eukprot:TRINITY_DN13333_c0_g1_i1.p1 TRINITY_DN13333_c0_g1~~TRINITY_DN13333_c0_g1_i1.p1  ORF type:complete len:391 (+),score=123.92 TRINITY_DN13333_c0_g1_i1:85-1257(+)
MASALRSRTPGRDAGAAAPLSVLEQEVAYLQGVQEACGEGCTARHAGPCLVCGEDYNNHRKHECPDGGRGRWAAAAAASPRPPAPRPKHQPRFEKKPLGQKYACCGGACLPSPDSTTFLCILLVVAVPVGFFVSFEPALWVRTAALLLMFAQLLSGACAVLLDPGVVLPEYKPQPPKGDALVPQFADGYTLNPGDEVVEVDGVRMVRRWCTTCGMLRPLRAAHCTECNVCVDEFDHHCPVIGSCVGRRTFRFFAMFLWFTAVLSWWVAVFTIRHLSGSWPAPGQREPSGRRRRGGVALQTYQMFQIMLVVFVIFIGICVGLFGCFYCSLALSNQTERENFKNMPGAKNPFDKGACVNFRDRICSRLPPSRASPEAVARCGRCLAESDSLV